MNRTDLADPSAGVLATLEGHQPLAVFERGGRGEVRFELEAESDNGRRLEFHDDELLGHWSIEPRFLHGRLRGSDGSTTPIEAIGAHSSGELGAVDAEAAGTDPARLRRSIVICLDDGGFLAIVAARGETAGEHDRERQLAALATPDGDVIEYPEVRLSTEYGPDRQQRRATIELWPENADSEGPLRGAGVVVAATTIELPGARSTLAFFEWSVAGSPGIGRYEIIRAL